jgi:asparagine synthase (glutamine-hydrolysing)
MCGIAGIIHWDGRPVAERDIRSMCDAMVHRGPDDEGLHIGPGVALGMRRLSIIDLAGGKQPVSNEDGTITVVFNGEIYNYRELRAELEAKGHVFRTHSDTETIVHLYEDLGSRCVDRLRGMFVFAVWDSRRHEILLARDRLGIKPLYYAEQNGSLYFASELTSILRLGDIERTLNWAAVGHLFTFLVTPPDESIIEGVAKLEPARVAVGARGRPLRIHRYWDVEFTPDEQSSEGELTERLRALVADAVRAHQISDVPTGAFLSGGIDSSAVVAMMTPPSSGPIKTFSIGFEEDGFDELQYARRVAAAFGTEHHDVVLRRGQATGLIAELTQYLDEPFGDASAIPTYLVSKLASEHVKVVLSGDGGDELFAGYDKYVVEGRERERDRLPGALRRAAGAVGSVLPDGARGRRFLTHLAFEGPQRFLDASTLLRRDEIRRVLTPQAFEQVGRHDPWAADLAALRRPHADWLAAIQYRDLNGYLPLDILTKVDRMTMAASIEARPPLLDHPLVEFAATIPARLRLHSGTNKQGTTKYLFKQAMRGVLPDGIIDRPKQGFAVPLGEWFRGELSDYARDLLGSAACRQRGVLDATHVDRLLAANAAGRDHGLQLWTLLSFELWCRRVLDGTADVGRDRAAAPPENAAAPPENYACA